MNKVKVNYKVENSGNLNWISEELDQAWEKDGTVRVFNNPMPTQKYVEGCAKGIGASHKAILLYIQKRLGIMDNPLIDTASLNEMYRKYCDEVCQSDCGGCQVAAFLDWLTSREQVE